MHVKLNIPKLGLFLALLLIGYQNITGMLWGGNSNNVVISLAMLVTAGISLFFLIKRPLPRGNIALDLIVYYVYIIMVCLFNGYLQIFKQEPTMLFTCAYWIFFFWLFRDIAKRNILTPEVFSRIFFALTIVCFVLFCRYYSINRAQIVQLSGLNIVYYLIFMLPIVLLSNKKKLSYIGIAISVLATILSSKRGALIAILVAVLVWAQMDLDNETTRRKITKSFGYIMLGAVGAVAIVVIVERMGLDILNRIESLLNGQDRDGSGRTKIWFSYLEYMQNDSLWHNLIGRGYNTTKRNPVFQGLSMGWAHNDFLQILFDYGFVGFTLFSHFIMKLFLMAKKMKVLHYRYRMQFVVSLVIFLLCCCFSMVTILPQWFLAMAAFWGYIVGDFEYESRCP